MAECLHLIQLGQCSLCLGLSEFGEMDWERKDYVEVKFVHDEEDEAEYTLEVEESTPEYVDEEELRKFGESLRVKSQKGKTMGLRFATPNVYLSEFKDELIAVRYNDMVHNVETEYGKVSVPRADIVLLREDDDGVHASFEGQGLVFQKAIANSISGSTDWVIGRLEQVERPTTDAPDATMYQFSDPGLEETAIVKAFADAGITL